VLCDCICVLCVCLLCVYVWRVFCVCVSRECGGWCVCLYFAVFFILGVLCFLCVRRCVC